MKLSLFFFAALFALSSCPKGQKTKCNSFKLELDKLLFMQDDERYVSYVEFDSLKTIINENVDCFERIKLKDLKKIFPNVQKSKKSPYTYYIKIANIDEGEILKDLKDISYTSLRFPLDSVDLTVKSVKVRELLISSDQMNSPYYYDPK